MQVQSCYLLVEPIVFFFLFDVLAITVTSLDLKVPNASRKTKESDIIWRFDIFI